jgi:hypothetical protein
MNRGALAVDGVERRGNAGSPTKFQPEMIGTAFIMTSQVCSIAVKAYSAIQAPRRVT